MKFILKDINHFYNKYFTGLHMEFLTWCEKNQNKIFDSNKILKNGTLDTTFFIDGWIFNKNEDVINLTELKFKFLEKYL